MFMFAMSALWTVALGVVANSADPPSIIFILSDDCANGDLVSVSLRDIGLT